MIVPKCPLVGDSTVNISLIYVLLMPAYALSRICIFPAPVLTFGEFSCPFKILFLQLQVAYLGKSQKSYIVKGYVIVLMMVVLISFESSSVPEVIDVSIFCTCYL